MPIADLLAPPALEFRRQDIALGDAEARVLAIVDYPPRVGPAWLARFGDLPGVSLSVHLVPGDPLELLRALNAGAAEYQSRLAQGGSALLRGRWERSLEDAQALLRQIDQEGQRVFRTTVVLLVTAPDRDELARRCRRVEAVCAGAAMRVRPAVFRQEQGLMAAGPWRLLPSDMADLATREMPAATVAAAYPWVSSGLNHGRGVVLGRDDQGGIVLIDRWDPPEGSGIANANVNILGTSGGGKSFAAKVLLLREFALGARVLVIDPEREYRGICAAVGGTWVNAAGGEGRVNPLQVRVTPERDADDEEGGRGPLPGHLQRVKTFFELYLPGLDDTERAVLYDAVLAAYRECGVDWDTDPGAVTVWPTVEDVQRHVSDHPRLHLLLKEAVQGADATLWNGQSRAPGGRDFTVLDVHDLVDASDAVRRAQYFNLLGYAWDLVRRGRATGRRTVLVVDEAWLLADPNTPQALGFLRDVSKRIRKYHGSLVVVTQNAIDFLAPELVRFGQPVLDNASTKLLMRQEARDLETLRDLLRLTEAECTLLASAGRGEGLLLADNRRVWVHTVAASHEATMMSVGPSYDRA